MRRTTLMLMVLTLACTQQHKHDKACDELSSWAGTGAELSLDWSAGRVDKPYAKSSVEVALNSLKGLADPVKDDDVARDALQRTTQLYDTLSRAIEKSDRQAAPDPSKFAAIRETLETKKQSSQSQ